MLISAPSSLSDLLPWSQGWINVLAVMSRLVESSRSGIMSSSCYLGMSICVVGEALFREGVGACLEGARRYLL